MEKCGGENRRGTHDKETRNRGSVSKTFRRWKRENGVKVRGEFGSDVVVESTKPSQNRERAKESCLVVITRSEAKGSNRKSTRSAVALRN